MIERYTLPKMGSVWSDENKFRTWLTIEILACEALAELGEIPAKSVEVIKEKADFDIARILEIEETTHHDVIAFLTNVAEYVGPDSRYIHQGMTSSDLLDTTLGCQLKEAGKLILERCAKLKAAIKKQALAHKHTIMIGRTHGIHAEPITFGLKMLMWYDEMSRRETAFRRAVETASYGKISGAVGTYAHLDRRVEAYVLGKLGLSIAPVSTQIVQRDRHAEYVTALALLAASLDKFATEIRHLQRTDVLEAEEFFKKGQKGSSAMPHKRNPIISENVCGLARLVRSYAAAAMDNVPLWHERDISHSSVERVILPDSTIAIDYMLKRFTWVVDNLLVYPENMMRNLEKTNGLIFSQKLLLELTRAGVTREDAYKWVQGAAMKTWEAGEPFEDSVRAVKEITSRLDAKTLDAVFTLDNFVKEVDAIFDRVL
ncbi:MAG: adenylosuccinate lyase [Candidatus Latescibacterota bacterium]|nr:MAG: adenylosuccinate lyase [Candidatus Latescibacterota bacterium]